MSTKPAAIAFTRIGASSTAAFAAIAGTAAAAMAAMLKPTPGRRAWVPVIRVSDPPGRTRLAHARAIRSEPSRCSSSTRSASSKSRSAIVEYVGPPPVTSTWSICAGRPSKNRSSAAGVADVERGRAHRRDLLSGPVEPVAVASGEDQLGAFRPRLACGLQTDARAAADDDDGLAGEAPGGLLGQNWCSGHDDLLTLRRVLARHSQRLWDWRPVAARPGRGRARRTAP